MTIESTPVVELSRTAPPPRRRISRVAALGCAASLLAGGSAFAANQLGTAAGAGGAPTPEGAVEAMLTSLEQNDWLGALDHLAPGEREVITDATTEYLGELERLGIIAPDMDLHAVTGFQVDFENVTYEVEQANQRVWMVGITGGQVTLGADVAELPLGKLVVDLLGPLPQDATEPVTIDLAELQGELADDLDEQLDDELDAELTEAPPRIGVVQQDGNYYVSALYTAAETLAATNGYVMPARPIPAVGAATPEDAVREMVQAAIDLDVAGLIQLTPPDEMAALHDYGQLLVDEANAAIATSDLEGLDEMTITIDALDFEQVPVTGGTKLLPTNVTISADAPDGTSLRFSARKVDTTCVEYDVETTVIFSGDTQTHGDKGRSCAADIYETFAGSDVPLEVQQIAERMLGQLGKIGIVTVQDNGAWYVSPLRTGSDVFLVALRGLQTGDIETLLEAFA
jgi:hypothetical protein